MCYRNRPNTLASDSAVRPAVVSALHMGAFVEFLAVLRSLCVRRPIAKNSCTRARRCGRRVLARCLLLVSEGVLGVTIEVLAMEWMARSGQAAMGAPQTNNPSGAFSGRSQLECGDPEQAGPEGSK